MEDRGLRAWLVGSYRRVVRLAPRDFRLYEPEMTAAFTGLLRDARSASGRRGVVRMWVMGMLDLMGAIVRERRQDRARTSRIWQGTLADARYALRGWRRSPAFPATALLTLIVGLGLATGIFAFADRYLFRPLPMPGAGQLYRIGETTGAPVYGVHATDVTALRDGPLAEFGFVDWGISYRVSPGNALIVGDRRVKVLTYDVTPGFGQMLGLPMTLGRWFSEADHQPGTVIPAWVSHKLWDRSMGQDPAVVGKTFLVVGSGVQMIEVVGVMGPLISSFDLNNEPPDLVVPGLPASPPQSPEHFYSNALVRLPAGMDRAQGEARLTAAYRALPPPPGPHPWTRGAIRLRSLREEQVAGGRPTATLLFVGAMLVLLLVLVNLVYLLLARGASRAHEIALRGALGASRWRTIRLFLVESALLAGGGIGGGLLVGRGLALVIDARIPTFPTEGRNLAMVPMHFDLRVVAFAVCLGLVVAALGAVWPAWRSVRRPLTHNVRGSGGVGGSLRWRVARVLLSSELAIATVVLVGTVFVGLGIWKYLNPPLGFDYVDRFWVQVDPPVAAVGGPQPRAGDLSRVTTDVQRVPGVIAVGAPWEYWGSGREIEVDGRVVSSKVARAHSAGVGNFTAWGVHLLKGRFFTNEEAAADAPVVVIDQKVATGVWADQEALGQSLRVGGGPGRIVIGIVEPLRRRLRVETPGEAYVPPAVGDPVPVFLVWAPGMTSDGLRDRLRTIANDAVPGGFLQVRPVVFGDTFLREAGEAEFQAPLVLLFGVLAVVIAGVGVFGLISYLVAQRTREFGIRLALGARPSDVWRFVVRQSLVPAALGLVVGVASAWGLDRVVRSQVFGWQASAPLAVAIVAVLLSGVAVLAAASPARRAMRVDPATVLRAE